MELQDWYTFTKGFDHLMWLDFPFKNLCMFRNILFFIIEKNLYIDTKSDDKESVLLFFAKILSTFLSLIIGVLGKRCEGGNAKKV